MKNLVETTWLKIWKMHQSDTFRIKLFNDAPMYLTRSEVNELISQLSEAVKTEDLQVNL